MTAPTMTNEQRTRFHQLEELIENGITLTPREYDEYMFLLDLDNAVFLHSHCWKCED